MEGLMLKNAYKSYSQLLWMLGFGFTLSLSASATGYYNFGAHWKGGLNPYRLGADSAFQSGFTSGLSAPSPGKGDGSLYGPQGVARDSSGNIYVVEYGSNRMSKYNSSGVFQGWIGNIENSPTGGAAGCAGAAAGTFTPGWCTGGSATSGSDDGMMDSPDSIALDSSGNLYVTDSNNNRINKYNSSGAFLGWIGLIATSPTGGAAGCAGAAVGTFTPGWCTGGTSQSGTEGDGSMDGPRSLIFDSSGNLYVTDTNNNRVNKYNSAGVFQGWLGTVFDTPTGGAAGCTSKTTGQFTQGWCVGGSGYSSFSSGGLHFPDGVALDSLGNIYVVSTLDNRITKYDSSGVFQGWIGRITNSKPTGGAAGCTTAAAGDLTPGWCIGGTPDTNFPTTGMQQPTGIVFDSSDSFYVTDTNNNRINKYNSSGVFQGWIGKIGTSPTGGAAGCNGASVGTFTPGWCTGGAPASGNGDGMVNSPAGITLDASGNLYVVDRVNGRINKYTSSGSLIGALQSVAAYFAWHRSLTSSMSGAGDGMLSKPVDVARDSAGNLYVVDSNNHRVNKYNPSGAFQGWIGKIATSPTGGAAGCVGAGVGTFTPGWCTGGTSTYGTAGDGSMNAPSNVALDSSGNLYVSDFQNSRINKYNSSGVFQGWIGEVYLVSPTGGAAGCTAATNGMATPGWCIGGTSTYDNGDGKMHGPRGIAVDSSGNLYIADTFNSRIVKYDSFGVFQGWIGKISLSPTGGAAGCAGASVGSFTPGWCTGGQGDLGTGDGMLNIATGLTLDSTGNLYVVDTNNNRISKYDLSSGAFLGWIGKIGTSPTGGAAGCNGASVGTVTPGWCTGGAAASGSGDGMLNNAFGIVIDKSSNIYVTERNNARISKYNSSGVFQGWIGKIGTSPTGGATGCNGAAVGTLTPGWCKGGTATSGSEEGAMNSPQGIALDPAGDLYVADWNNNRILRFSIQGR
jgi:membrane-bound lytic murein transglycosylase B